MLETVPPLAPGQFRTDWAGRSMARTPRSIADYDGVMDPLRAARQAKSGRQPGDPARAAQALLALVASPEPPARLLLGADALGLVRGKLDAMRAEKYVPANAAAYGADEFSNGLRQLAQLIKADVGLEAASIEDESRAFVERVARAASV